MGDWLRTLAELGAAAVPSAVVTVAEAQGSTPREAGTKMIVTSHFDNSAENRWNPDPEMWVYWGDDSRDEMMEC